MPIGPRVSNIPYIWVSCL